MKLHQHFSINFTIIFVGSILFTALISYYTLKEVKIEQYKHAIKTHMNLVKLHIEDVDDLDTLAKEIKKSTGYRFTLIDDNGVVFAESDYDVSDMENHSDRKEIKIARSEGEGYSIRHSHTLGIDFLYMASQFYLHKKPIFIRLSEPLDSIYSEFMGMWVRITAILAFAIIFGIFMVYRLSAKINQEITKVTQTLDEISNKNYKAIVNATFSDEFKQIEAHTKKLSQRLEKREKQKRKYNAKIRLISKQRSDIISAISHEFKNPVASIMGYAQTLIEDPNANPSIKARFLEKIIKNSQKITAMIDRLSLATKFENGDLAPMITRFDIYELCEEVILSFKDKFADRTLELRGENLIIEADKTMIEMVLVNLIDNAIKYSEDKIIIEIEENFLHVKDNGIGLQTEEIDKVTNKFYRSNTLSWDNSIGLGLALVKHILSLHDTKLQIESTFGVGSDFYFRIK